MDRILGRYVGETHGPMLICIGGIHGNEVAGVEAIETVLKMLEVEPITNPDFVFNGCFVGIAGNLPALAIKERFIKEDLNRMFTKENIAFVMQSVLANLSEEYKEMRSFIDTVKSEIDTYKPTKLYVLDLHTTSSFGGIFTIVTDDKESLRIGLDFHAPVIKDMTKGLVGTLLHYFTTKNMGIETTIVTFEAGQHDERLSVNRGIAATINCLKSIGSVRPNDVENIHNDILIESSKHLPKVAQLISHHQITDSDAFKMRPEYKNFQAIRKGDLLAEDKLGNIYSDDDAMILMPLYQNKGRDGFFIIREIKDY